MSPKPKQPRHEFEPAPGISDLTNALSGWTRSSVRTGSRSHASPYREVKSGLGNELSGIHDSERVERLFDRAQGMDPPGRRQACELSEL